MKAKTRLDKLLVELGFFDSREKAQTCIMMHGVKIAGVLASKPGMQIDEAKFYSAYQDNPSYLEVEHKLLPYVSRGAFKLQAAHQAWGLDFANKTVLDIGASTGGFSDYVLQNGAARVIALDVGHGQLHYKLQGDSRVINLEGVNFREVVSLASLQANRFDDDPVIQIIVIDVSFISLITILDKLKSLLTESPQKSLDIIALIKPQFEADKKIMDQCQGIIRDEKTREMVKDKVCSKILALGYEIEGLIESPIKGGAGNIEYLVRLNPGSFSR